jgi:hypothetical protein
VGAGQKKNGPATAEIVQPSNVARAVWEDSTLLVWQDALPTGAAAQRVRAFVQEGGTVIFLPTGAPDSQRFEGLGWGEGQSAPVDRPFRVLRWNEEEGPLAKSDEGLSLPLPQTAFVRRQAILGQKTILAAFEDGTAFLARQTLGRGELFFCASLPDREWSSLGDGPVLVPMMQRLLQSGTRRLQQATSIACGELSVVDQTRKWISVDDTGSKDIRTEAGVYRSGDRLLAVNRPAAEDAPEVLEGNEAKGLFGPLSFQMLQDKRSPGTDLQGEIWRIFLVTMLLFLVAEAALVLPPKPAFPPPHQQTANRSASREEVEVGA